ncbi:MAG: FeoB-associated Cys-rich membrane protein [Bacteroidia bacterium]
MANIQEIIVFIIFAGALFYIGRRLWNTMRKKDCGGGCAACGGIDIKVIEDKIRKEQH